MSTGDNNKGTLDQTKERAYQINKTIRDKLAALSHERWSKWAKYLFSKGSFNKDGTWTMPKEFVERWSRQALTSFDNLPEEEKINDYQEAEYYIHAYKEATEDNQ